MWGSFSLSRPSGKSLVYDIEIEPKLLVVVPDGKPEWATLEVTPSVDFAANHWLDVIGELATGYTKQSVSRVHGAIPQSVGVSGATQSRQGQ